jgi:hypothetical protein
MRPIRTLLVAVALVLAACAAAPASSTHTPRLSLHSTQPMTVYGYRFARHERVRVTVRTPAGHWTRHVRAGRHGRFTVTLPSVTQGPCGGYRVRAVGARSGRRAVLEHPKLPECMAL